MDKWIEDRYFRQIIRSNHNRSTKTKNAFEYKEYYLDEWANMNSPVQLAEKLEEFEDFKRTLKQKSSSPIVKKQEYKFTEKNRRYEAPGKLEYNRKDKKFPASTNYNEHYEAPVTKYESVQRYQDSAQKGYYEKHSNHNASKHIYAQTNYSKSQKFKEPTKETCTIIVKEEELDLRHVENRQIKKEFEKLIQDYKPEKTASTDVTMRIILKDEEPVCQHPRRLAFTERQVNKQIEKWLNKGIIRPSSSEYASAIVMVKKKDGSLRICIHYRKLNQKLVKDKFPLPIIEDVLDTLQEAKVYSTLDLRNGFFHVDVDEDCRKYTSFIVPDGQFEFNKVPFGLITSPGVFQRYVSSIFRDLTRKGIVISYLDDLVIPAKNEQEGLEKLKIIFEVAKKYGLEIKFKKCQFLKKKIEFLGHIVESGTIKPSPTKTLAVRKFPEPTTIKQVQSFLGLTEYFRKYIKYYSKIAKPLSNLTRKENLFVLGAQQKEAFEKLKKIMSEGPILHIYKYGRKTELHAYACKQGYGAILLQEAEDGKFHLVYYMSKTNTAEEKCGSYELENTMQKKELITRIARWALQLEEFDYEIEHRAGSRMKHVDALSRYPVMIVCNDTLTSKLKKAQKEDDNIQTLQIPSSAYTSKLFNDYCDEENIQHLQIATGGPRGKGQVERIHRTLIPVLTKLSLDSSTKWYKYVDRLQRILNSTICRSKKWTPFELLVGTKMRNKEDILIKDLLLEEMAKELLEQREFSRNYAKKNIETLQSENRKAYNRRKKASLYKEGV
ncbi:retrovirus-related Pol polyprotein from transposon 17.6 [Trichonephila clavipes]|nr:retrovirus-related Pol polyprotein from transposon 17.6 [Trichonephila clavipes]